MFTFVGASYGFHSTTIGMPAGFAAGDLLLYHGAWPHGAGTVFGVAPPGWTLLGRNGTAVFGLMAYRIADGTETTAPIATDTISGNNGDASIAAYRSAGSTILVTTGDWTNSGYLAPTATLTQPAIIVPGSAFVIAGFSAGLASDITSLTAGAGWTQDSANLGTGIHFYVFEWQHSPTRLSGSVAPTATVTSSSGGGWWGQAVGAAAARTGLSMLV